MERKKVLVTGGTVFVSRYVAEYFRDMGYDVYVLNRNSRPQSEGVTLIEGDRRCLGDPLKQHRFDAVLDMTAYTGEDVDALLDALGDFGTYILLSSSAVYPETARQPFTEETPVGPNCHWGAYGTGKIAAEQALTRRVPDGYILRPPYLYGPGNNVYREAFVFDCAMADRKFYLPKDGGMKLQFFHVRDLCRAMETILEKQPVVRVYNVGNRETVTIRDWVALCYQAAGADAAFVNVLEETDQRNYFSFYNYEYELDVEKQSLLLDRTIPLEDGLKEAFDWYVSHTAMVRKKPYLQYIDAHFDAGAKQ